MKSAEAQMPDGFELDRTTSGKMKVNVISIANLLALIAVLGTAISSWNDFSNKVNAMAIRVDSATREVAQIRTDMQTSLIARDGENRELRGKVELIGNRLVAVETVLQRVERKLDEPRPGSR